mmetsp:Transcript_1288/g.2576  ORF Transcript_1288/g.2576 Transcript_1288/m.2576 type:complete len:388 (-) Transcript_1288:99-1262(-)
MEKVQADLDLVLGVVFAGNHLVFQVRRRRVELNMVRVACLRVNPPSNYALHEVLVRDVQHHKSVYLDSHLLQGFCLGGSSRKTVQKKAVLHNVWLLKALFDGFDHNFIRDKLAAFHEFLGFFAYLGARRYSCSEHIPGRKVDEPVRFADPLALCPLSARWCTCNNYAWGALGQGHKSLGETETFQARALCQALEQSTRGHSAVAQFPDAFFKVAMFPGAFKHSSVCISVGSLARFVIVREPAFVHVAVHHGFLSLAVALAFAPLSLIASPVSVLVGAVAVALVLLVLAVVAAPTFPCVDAMPGLDQVPGLVRLIGPLKAVPVGQRCDELARAGHLVGTFPRVVHILHYCRHRLSRHQQDWLLLLRDYVGVPTCVPTCVQACCLPSCL